MKITDFIVCEDIRREINGKHSLMGAFNDVIRLIIPPGTEPRWPVNVRFATFTRFALDPGEQLPDQIGIKVHLGEDLAVDALVNITVSEFWRPLQLIMGPIELQVPGPALMKFEFTLKREGQVLATLEPQTSMRVTDEFPAPPSPVAVPNAPAPK